MKECFKCGAVKDINEFYVHYGMKDRHLGKCKECTKKDAAKHRNDNLEACQAYDRARCMEPQRIELRRKVTLTWLEDGRQAENQRKYRDKYPERYIARNILSNAKRDGKIEQPKTCSECGVETNNLEAHHGDYSKPLDVKWLCVPCHCNKRRKYPKEPENDQHKQPVFKQMDLFEKQAVYAY